MSTSWILATPGVAADGTFALVLKVSVWGRSARRVLFPAESTKYNSLAHGVPMPRPRPRIWMAVPAGPEWGRTTNCPRGASLAHGSSDGRLGTAPAIWTEPVAHVMVRQPTSKSLRLPLMVTTLPAAGDTP